MAESCENVGTLVVSVEFPFTLGTPKYGPSRPFVGDHAAKAAYVDALEAELASLDDEVRARPVQAVRLHGGASIMSADKVCHLVRSIKKTLNVQPGCEVSIDVEPLTVCTPSLTDWTSCGVTRVNLDVVSVLDEELSAFGAHHSRSQLQNALLFLERFHVGNVCHTLLFGLPGQTPASWERSLVTSAGVDTPQISVRPLVDTREQGTTSESGPTPLPTREQRASFYAQAVRVLEKHGYEEIAPGDFVKQGLAHAASAYDALVRAGADVLGLGAGAKTRMDGFMYENACDFDLYVAKSADFEAIVRNPLREDAEARAARAATPLDQMSEPERFEALERLGAALAR